MQVPITPLTLLGFVYQIFLEHIFDESQHAETVVPRLLSLISEVLVDFFSFPHSRSFCFFVKFQKQTFPLVIILAAIDFSTCSLL